MPRLFLPPAGAAYPASPADYRAAKAGRMESVTFIFADEGVPIPAPYPEIIPSWLAAGFVELDGGK